MSYVSNTYSIAWFVIMFIFPIFFMNKSSDNPMFTTVTYPLSSWHFFHQRYEVRYLDVHPGNTNLVGGSEHVLFFIYFSIYWEEYSQQTNSYFSEG